MVYPGCGSEDSCHGTNMFHETIEARLRARVDEHTLAPASVAGR